MKNYVLKIGSRKFTRITKKRALELLKIEFFEDKVFFNNSDNRYYLETTDMGVNHEK